MALTKDQYERLIAAAERIADALEGSASQAVARIPDDEAAEIDAAIGIPPAIEPEPEEVIETAEDIDTSTPPISEEYLAQAQSKLQDAAKRLNAIGLQGRAVVGELMQRNGFARLSEAASVEQVEAAIEAIHAELTKQGA